MNEKVAMLDDQIKNGNLYGRFVDKSAKDDRAKRHAVRTTGRRAKIFTSVSKFIAIFATNGLRIREWRWTNAGNHLGFGII